MEHLCRGLIIVLSSFSVNTLPPRGNVAKLTRDEYSMTQDGLTMLVELLEQYYSGANRLFYTAWLTAASYTWARLSPAPVRYSASSSGPSLDDCWGSWNCACEW